MDDSIATNGHARPGYRLHKLEVYNWGTFDSTRGQVYTVRPSGQTALLIGQNGSGKSTLVDALLTMLVHSSVRNYNVAAGAKKKERDERTYIKGACGRLSRDEDNRADVQFLRPSGSHYSALLACFRNEVSHEAFTLAQILYLNGEGKAEKIFCFATGERSIATDFAGITSMDKVKQQLQKRGFKATDQYKEYHAWLVKATGMRPKAMAMFNQTVAVKDIQSLNHFIRDHMLEAPEHGENVAELLQHFTLLSDAHQSLMRVRKQYELLEPIVSTGAMYRAQAEQLHRVQRMADATDVYFRQKTIDLFVPECELWRGRLQEARVRREQIDREIGETREKCRQLQNAIDKAGGDRLRLIPSLIATQESEARSKRKQNDDYHSALRAAEVKEPVTTADEFAALRARLRPLPAEIDQQIAELSKQRDGLAVERALTERALNEQERELEALTKRQTNLPESSAELRRAMCQHLRLPENELPFAAELIAVKPDEREWEASIEMVLRGLALSLLVPQRYYAMVSEYVDRTRMTDSRGEGQRLVYLRVGDQVAAETGPAQHPQALPRKLDLREGHRLLPWLKAELHVRFEYRCCDTVAEFQATHGLAMTRQRHVKTGTVRHDKNDRQRAGDPRHFVLGWDNQEKRNRLAEEIRRLREEQTRHGRRIETLDDDLQQLRSRRAGVLTAMKVADFNEIDYLAHERQIEQLQREKTALEEKKEPVRLLKQQKAEAESLELALQGRRDDEIRGEAKLDEEIRRGERLVENARGVLRKAKADGTLQQHAEVFPDLEACFEAEPLTAGNLHETESSFTKQRQATLEVLHEELDPIRNDLVAAMSKFLRGCPDAQADLDARVEYLDSFFGLREQIERDDLPRHEQRFKERLNEKVLQEIGFLNGGLQTERGEITAKIDLLNKSLRQLEYRPGTFMMLEPRPALDREITEFQEALRECLAGTFEGTLAADEARYLRIEKLIVRLREDQRWAEKVTDVRRWFDFVAREIDAVSGAERNYFADSTGQSGGEKAKLAFTILVAAIAYQYDIDPEQPKSNRFHFVVVDEMFSKVDDQYSEYALELFQKFGLQLLIVAPLDAKARVTEPYVGCYLHVVKDPQTNRSELFTMTAREFEAALSEDKEQAFEPSEKLRPSRGRAPR